MLNSILSCRVHCFSGVGVCGEENAINSQVVLISFAHLPKLVVQADHLGNGDKEESGLSNNLGDCLIYA